MTAVKTCSAPPVSFLGGPGRRKSGKDRKTVFGAKLQQRQQLQGLRRQARSLQTTQASANPQGPVVLLKQVASSKLYKWGFEGAVVVGLVMLVDAGYSGDWSRIGAISKELEAELKGIAPLVGAFHLFCSPIAALVAARRGLNTPKAVAKTLLVGGPALFEMILSDTTD